MNNKPSLIVAAVLLGLAGWWMLLNRESDPAKSGPPESASADSGTYLQEFESALRRAESDLR